MNALANETSPSLLQHKGNPVDWLPRGPEALDRARREDRPLLVSIGYSSKPTSTTASAGRQTELTPCSPGTSGVWSGKTLNRQAGFSPTIGCGPLALPIYFGREARTMPL